MFAIGMFLISATVFAQAQFEKDVLPVFAKRCQGCHGAQQQMAGLRLDREDASVAKAAPKMVDRVTSDKKGFRIAPRLASRSRHKRSRRFAVGWKRARSGQRVLRPRRRALCTGRFNRRDVRDLGSTNGLWRG